MKIYSSWVSLGSLFWLWLPSFLLKVGLSRLSVYSRKLQIVELEHVFTHDLAKNIRRQMAQLLGNHFPRMRPGGRRVRIVIRPHAGIRPPPVEQTPAGRVAKKCRIDLFAILARQLLHGGDRRARGMTNKVLVPFMNVERHPSNLVLDIDEFEARNRSMTPPNTRSNSELAASY